jgi:M6 family metalloprotease-like protein
MEMFKKLLKFPQNTAINSLSNIPLFLTLCLMNVIFSSSLLAKVDSAETLLKNKKLKKQGYSVQTRDCSSADWYSIQSGNLFNSTDEIALLDGGNPVVYGYYIGSDEQVKFRECELNHRENIIRVPVFLVDWDDFDPATDLSNPNNPNSVQGPNYQRTSVAAIDEYLNGAQSPSKYFQDISGGRIRLQFDVFGWLSSADIGTYIKKHEQYLYQSENDNRWYCRRDLVIQDTLKEVILNQGMDPSVYDMNNGLREHDEGFLNGAVLIYEGGSGSCSGTNMSHMGIGSFDPGTQQAEAGIETFNLHDLTSDDPTHNSILAALNINFRVYNNLPESSVYNDDLFGWTHELGHMFLGFSDYYDPKFNMGNYALSANSYSNQPLQPAGFEKWLMAKWINPQLLIESGDYTIASHDISDDGDYNANEPYLYRFDIDEEAGHFLLIENRWLNDAGNVGSSWVSSYRDNFMPPSGLQIFEVNLKEDSFSNVPTIYRISSQHDEPLSSWIQGKTFNKCFGNNCIRLDDISEVGKHMTFSFATFVDSDGDGVADADDAFPNDVSEQIDTDNDGIGNNADSDDDNDGVEDNNDAFPLDNLESVDTDGDGIGNNADIDDDNDGTEDTDDAFPLDNSESVDTDGDGIGNNADLDDDNDGVADTADAFPLDASKSAKEPQKTPEKSGGGGAFGGGLMAIFCLVLIRRKLQSI